MKVLVTGCAGFIGSALSNFLAREGAEVVGIDAFTPYYSAAVKDSNLQYSTISAENFTRGRIQDVSLSRLLKDVEIVFHQAGAPGVRSSWGTDFGHYVEANILATQQLLEACLGLPSLRRFVYASSSSIYGRQSHFPISESSLPNPRSPYGVTKLGGEQLVSLYAENFGLPTVSLRYFTVYGPRQRPDMAFTRLCSHALTGTPIEVFGDGSQVRDFTFVDDIVSANWRAATTDLATFGQAFNVAGGSQTTLNDAIAIVESLAGREILRNGRPNSPGDVARTQASAVLANSVLNWAPRKSILDGLEAQFDWVANNLEVVAPAVASST